MTMDGDTRTRLVADLIESDVAYFEADADVETLPGARITHMPGLHSIAAGCVVQCLDYEALERSPLAFVDRVEGALRDLGVKSSRIYLHNYSSDVDSALVSRGYQSSVELAIALGAAQPVAGSAVSFRVIESDSDWAEKQRIHEAMGRAPDGHEVHGADWVAMERRKCEAGSMTPYLAFHRGQVVGAVNGAPWKSVLRLKNVFVHSDARLRGMGSAIARQFGPLAAGMDKVAAGAFVLADAAFINMYTAAGYEVVAQQTEWCREL
jgi:hypothetical protein